MNPAELPVAMMIGGLVTGPAAYWIARSLQPLSFAISWLLGILVVGILLALTWLTTFAIGIQFVPWNMYAPLTSSIYGCFMAMFVGPICFAAGAASSKKRHRDEHISGQ